MSLLVHPYAIKKEQRSFTEKEINYPEKLGIMKKGLIRYIHMYYGWKERKQNLYIVCTDLWLLNDKLVQINHISPIPKDCIQAIGQSHSEVMSIADLSDIYHTLRFTSDS